MAGARDTKRAATRAERKAAMAETENQKRLDSRRATLETRARVDADNEAVYQNDPHAAARRNVPSDQKAMGGPLENKTTGLPVGTRRVDPVGSPKRTEDEGAAGGTDALEGVTFASPEARQAAADAGLTAESFKRRRHASEKGYTKADVERIAASAGTADEE